jgi:hypothetical protein
VPEYPNTSPPEPSGLAAGTLAELLTDNAAAVDLSGVALVVRAQ